MCIKTFHLICIDSWYNVNLYFLFICIQIYLWGSMKVWQNRQTYGHARVRYIQLNLSYNISHKLYIKIDSSESQGQGAACKWVFRPMRPLQWVIYIDGSSKICKHCTYLSHHSSYHLVYYSSSTNWIELTTVKWNKLVQPFLRIRILLPVSVTKTNTHAVIACIILITIVRMNTRTSMLWWISFSLFPHASALPVFFYRL